MKKNNLIFKFFVLYAIIFSASGFSQTVTIGSQVWTSKNLNVSTYRNGDIIPQVQNEEAWAKLTTGAWCYYDNDTSNGTKYGKLYNWYAVHDPRGLAPKGYHIPTDAEWKALTDYLGSEREAGTKMKSENGWKSYTSEGSKTCPNCASWNTEYRKKVQCQTCKNTRSVSATTAMNSGNGSNSSGFSGLPGGYRATHRSFHIIDSHGFWWSLSECDSFVICNSPPEIHAYARILNFNNGEVESLCTKKREGFSVRCLRD